MAYRRFFNNVSSRRWAFALSGSGAVATSAYFLYNSNRNSPYYADSIAIPATSTKGHQRIEVPPADWKERSRLDIGGEEDRRREAKGVWIWGDNHFGLIPGRRSSTGIVKRPRRVPFLEGKALRDLVLAQSFAAAVDENGDVVVWGDISNDTTLDNDPSLERLPSMALVGKDIVSLTAGVDRFFALSRDGGIYGVSLDPALPACIRLEPDVALDAKADSSDSKYFSWFGSSPKEKFVSVSTGADHLLALTSAGRAFATPLNPYANENGQLGVRRVLIDEPPTTKQREQQQQQQQPTDINNLNNNSSSDGNADPNASASNSGSSDTTKSGKRLVYLLPQAIAATLNRPTGGGREIGSNKTNTPPINPHLLPPEIIEEMSKKELAKTRAPQTQILEFEDGEVLTGPDQLPEVYKPYAAPFFSSTLHEIPSLRGVKLSQLSAGEKHSIALTQDGKVLGWGNNNFGQLGLGPNLMVSAIPVPTQIRFPQSSLDSSINANVYDRAKGGQPTCTSIFAGGNSSYFVFTSGNGANTTRYDLLASGSGLYGGNGNGSYTHQFVPCRIRSLSGLAEWNEEDNKLKPIGYSDISVGRGHVAVVLENAYVHKESQFSYGKDVFVWGLNTESQLGVGTKSNAATPRAVDPLPTQKQLQQQKIQSSDTTTVDQTTGGDMPHKRLQLCEGKVNDKGTKKWLEETIVAGYGTTAIYWRVKPE